MRSRTCHDEAVIETLAIDARRLFIGRVSRERGTLALMPKAAITKAHCNSCGHATKHHILFAHLTKDEHDEFGVLATAAYELLECCGCELVCLRETSWWAPEDETRITIYPPRLARRTPDWQFRLPMSIRAVLQEVYTALHANSLRLAMMGARAILDLTALDRVGDQGHFKAALQALNAAGVISAKAVDVLYAAFDAGSAAAHRGHEPSLREVTSVIDIIENLLQAVYVLNRVAESLKKKTPSRETTKKNSHPPVSRGTSLPAERERSDRAVIVKSAGDETGGDSAG